MHQHEREINKAEFKALYFEHTAPFSGWTQEYWDQFFEYKEGQQYYVYKSGNPEALRMFIREDGNKHCIFFLAEESEESFFDFPGKE
jgi:hypothetical protein